MKSHELLNCEEAELHLILKLSDELDDSTQLDLHLKNCKTCQSTLTSFEQINRVDQFIAPKITQLPFINKSRRIYMYATVALLLFSIGAVALLNSSQQPTLSIKTEHVVTSDFDPFSPIKLSFNKKRTSLTSLSDELSRFERRLDSIQTLNIYKGPSRAKK